MKSKKFEEYKKNEISAPWAILGGEYWVDTGYYNNNNVLCYDVADRETFVPQENRYLPGDVRFLGEPIPPIYN